MKTVSAGTLTDLASSGVHLNVCVRITAKDGTILGFTNNTRDIEFEGLVYKATTPVNPTALSGSNTLAVENLDITIIRSIDAVTGPDLLRGRWDFADVRMFLLNPNNVANGPVKLRRGRVGNVSLTRQRLTTEIRGMLDALTKQIIELYAPGCRVDLFSTRCGVPEDPPIWLASTAYAELAPFDIKIGSIVRPSTENGRFFICTVAGTSGGTEPSWDTTIGNTTIDNTVTWEAIRAFKITGTVQTVVSGKRIITTDLTDPDDFYSGGLLTWLTGNNAGASMEVKRYQNASGQIDLVLPMWFAIEPIDTFTVTAGCFKRVVEDCKEKFRNTHNFQGEPYVQQNFDISPARVSQNTGGK